MVVKDELAKLTNTELVAYWNIIQMGKRMGGFEDNEPIVDELLTERGIAHEANKLTKKV
jgi:hypothetical protein